jgi:hypothetical protein
MTLESLSSTLRVPTDMEHARACLVISLQRDAAILLYFAQNSESFPEIRVAGKAR